MSLVYLRPGRRRETLHASISYCKEDRTEDIDRKMRPDCDVSGSVAVAREEDGYTVTVSVMTVGEGPDKEA